MTRDDAFAEFMDDYSVDLDEAEEMYLGEYDSFEEFAENYVDGLPSHLEPYFDLSSFASDLEMDYVVFESGYSSVFIFDA